jgi:AraC family transcriptional activator of pobA
MLNIAPICFDRPAVLKLQKPYAVLLIKMGEGGLTLDTHKIDVLPGRVFLLRENFPVMLEGNTLTGHLVEFQEVMLNTFLLQFTTHRGKGLYNPNVVLPYADLNSEAFSFLTGLITQLGYEMDSGTPVVIFRHYLFVLLRHVNRQIEKDVVMISAQEQKLMMLMTLLDKNYRKNRKTDFYAKGMGMRARQLNDFVQQLFGKRFFELLMERVFAEADLLLVDNKLPIKTIAYELGFSDQNHFSIYYSRYRGYTPGFFRNKFCK